VTGIGVAEQSGSGLDRCRIHESAVVEEAGDRSSTRAITNLPAIPRLRLSACSSRRLSSTLADRCRV
jgi:hypothetical protein